MTEKNKQPEIAGDIISYFKIQYEIFQLKAARQAALAGSAIFAVVFFTTLVGLAFIIASVGLALFFASWLQSYYQGFLLTGALYLVIALFFFILRRSLILNPIRNKLISAFLNSLEKSDKS